MQTSSIRHDGTRALCAAFVAALLAAPASANDGLAVGVTALADRYVVAGRGVDDLNVLETKLRSLDPSAVSVRACGPQANRALLAIAHRFRDVHLRMRIVATDEPECLAAANLLALTAVAYETNRDPPGPRGIDDAAVRRYWEQVAP